MSRFSKKTMIEVLFIRAHALKEEYGLVSTEGWSQVARRRYVNDDAKLQAVAAYGEYRAHLDVIQMIEEGSF